MYRVVCIGMLVSVLLALLGWAGHWSMGIGSPLACASVGQGQMPADSALSRGIPSALARAARQQSFTDDNKNCIPDRFESGRYRFRLARRARHGQADPPRESSQPAFGAFVSDSSGALVVFHLPEDTSATQLVLHSRRLAYADTVQFKHRCDHTYETLRRSPLTRNTTYAVSIVSERFLYSGRLHVP